MKLDLPALAVAVGGSDGIGAGAVVTLYGVVAGAIGGALLAWLYNVVVRSGEGDV